MDEMQTAFDIESNFAFSTNIEFVQFNIERLFTYTNRPHF